MAAYVGQLFGIDPLAVINRQRLAAGMEALQLPESTMSFSNTVNPALKRMLDSYQTPQTSTRAMISTRTFNPTLVPKGYGSLVVQAAQNANINPIYVAAFAEAENGSWDTNAFSMGGSAAGVGLMQLNQAYFGSEQQLQDPAYNLNTGAQELARLAGNYSNWKDIIYAWNMGETGFANWVAAGRPDTAQAGYAAGLYERFEKARAKYGDVEALRSKGTLRSGFINKTSNSDTGFGWQPVSMQDEQGRPVVMSRDAASAFSQMVQDSGGMVKGMDITSSKRSEAKNRAVGGVSGSRHLHGEAIDIHGQSKKWMIENGPRYGWHLVDYPGSHGGHFEYRGS
jgi:hypothetical protein